MFRRSEKAKAEKLLKEVAEDTGGRAFFPAEPGEMRQIADQISHDLRTQYVVTYAPTNGRRDGSFRRVQVKVSDPRNPLARTRSGYYSPRGDAPGGPGRRS